MTLGETFPGGFDLQSAIGVTFGKKTGRLEHCAVSETCGIAEKRVVVAVIAGKERRLAVGNVLDDPPLGGSSRMSTIVRWMLETRIPPLPCQIALVPKILPSSICFRLDRMPSSRTDFLRHQGNNIVESLLGKVPVLHGTAL